MNVNWWTWENPVALWWLFLVCASIVNIIAWSWTKFYLTKTDSRIWFSACYVFGCAFRSILPRADVQRICLFDTWFSNVLIGRTVATIAEVAFVIQWTICLRALSEEHNSKLANRISKIIVPMILFAEVCSWYAVISTHYLGNTIEESTWGITYLLIGIAIFDLSRSLKGAFKLAARIAIVGCALYVGFMFTVDVPMYVSRLIVDTQNHKQYFDFMSGIINLNSTWIVTHDIKDWKTEIPWMSLYFSSAVWVSIALCYVPLKKNYKLKKS